MASILSKEPNRFEVGARIRELRKAKGWTQTELGDAAGLGQSAISSIEKGKTTKPEAVSILRIAAALKASPFYILWDHDLPDVVSQTMGQLIDLWTHLNDEDRARVVAYARGLFDARGPNERRNLRKPGSSPKPPPSGSH